MEVLFLPDNTMLNFSRAKIARRSCCRFFRRVDTELMDASQHFVFWDNSFFFHCLWFCHSNVEDPWPLNWRHVVNHATCWVSLSSKFHNEPNVKECINANASELQYKKFMTNSKMDLLDVWKTANVLFMEAHTSWLFMKLFFVPSEKWSFIADIVLINKMGNQLKSNLLIHS